MSSEQVMQIEDSSPYKNKLEDKEDLNISLANSAFDLVNIEDHKILDMDLLKQGNGNNFLVLQYFDDKEVESIKDFENLTTLIKRKRSSINVGVDKIVENDVEKLPSGGLNSSFSPFSASLDISGGSFLERCSKIGYMKRSASKDKKGTCPICQEVMVAYLLETHAAHCDNYPGKENIPTGESFQVIRNIFKSPCLSKSLYMEVFEQGVNINKYNTNNDEVNESATNAMEIGICVDKDVEGFATTNDNTEENSCGKDNTIIITEAARNVDEDLERNLTIKTKQIDVAVGMGIVVDEIVRTMIDDMLTCVDKDVEANVSTVKYDSVDTGDRFGRHVTYELESTCEGLGNKVCAKVLTKEDLDIRNRGMTTWVKHVRKQVSQQCAIGRSETCAIVTSLKKQREKLRTLTSKEYDHIEKNKEMMDNLGKMSNLGLYHQKSTVAVKWSSLRFLGKCLNFKQVEEATEEVELEEIYIGTCPLCSEYMNMDVLETHAADCQG